MNELPKKKPWQQWAEETDTSYDRFSTYMEMGPNRSLEKVRQKYGKTTAYKRQLERWSSKNNWVERVKAYDRHLTTKSLQNKEKMLDHAHAKLLNAVDEAIDELIGVLHLSNYKEIDVNDERCVVQTDPQMVSQKLKAIEIILKKAGVVDKDKEDLPVKKADSYNTFIQNIYKKTDRIKKEIGIE